MGWAVWDRISVGTVFPPVQAGPGAHPASCKIGTGSFPGVKCGQGVLLTTHPLLVPFHGRVDLYLYAPSGPHWACSGITLPFFFIRWGWVVNAMTWQLYCLGKRASTQCTGGWVCPRAGLDRCEKSRSTRATEDGEVSYIN